MAEERDYVNWEKLVEYPVYNASMMKPCQQFESSILGVLNTITLTPDSAYENTTNNKHDFSLRIFSRRYTENKKDASISIPMDKQQFTEIMRECVKTQPKKYTWEHPIFNRIFDEGISSLCNKMNTLDIDELFLRSKKDYVLSTGQGFIYNDEMISGAFSGMIMKAEYSSGKGILINITIPRYIHNAGMGSFESSTFSYIDRNSNLQVCISGAYLKKKEDGTLYICQKNSDPILTIRKADNKINKIYLIEGEYSELLTRRLYVPMSKLDFRLSSILSDRQKPFDTVISTIPMEAIKNRLMKIRR